MQVATPDPQIWPAWSWASRSPSKFASPPIAVWRRTKPTSAMSAPAIEARPTRLIHALSNASAACLLPTSAPLVEVELGQGPLDPLGGHPLRDLEVAGPHGDFVERDYSRQAVAVDDGQPAHPVLHHQGGSLVQLHLGLTGDQRP